MSLHQIIYTSCMRGINGVNDGQQIFSYDSGFKDANNDDIKSLFSYQPPALPPGVIMTEEIATTMPQSFTYRKINDTTCAIALNTYLGRDYMGSAGRFGNHLSHVVEIDEDELTTYPCEYFGSSLLRNRMDFEEVNNPNPPDFLPTPVLEKGYTVDTDSVIDFLSIGSRLDIYKEMLYAMLAFEDQRKRIVICDEVENIIMWIAALEYALPLRNVLNINFSTYEFDPSLSASQICGVVLEGTRFNYESSRLHFVFDFFNNQYPEFEKDNDFYDFIDTAFSLSYDSLCDFHDFLTNGYSYTKADADYYSGYSLYSMLVDGIGNYSYQKIAFSISFCEKYANDNELTRVIGELITDSEHILDLDTDSFLCICNFISSHKEKLSNELHSQFKQIIIDKILNTFVRESISESGFSTFFNSVENVAHNCGFSVSKEIMIGSNRSKLFEVMKNDISNWKISFIVHVVSTYAKQTVKSVDELSFESPIGQIYYGIINAVYSKSANNGFYLVKQIIDEFSNDCNYMLNMSLNIEGILLDVSDNNQVAALWKYFSQSFVDKQNNRLEYACSFFEEYQRYAQIYMLYSESLEKSTDVVSCQNIFKLFFTKYILRNKEYSKRYLLKSIDLYYDKLRDYDSGSSREAKIDLFDIILSTKINVSFADELVSDLMRDVPLEKPTRDNTKLIKNAFAFTYNINRQRVSGKLLLLLIGMVLEDVKSRRKLQEKIDQIEIMSQGYKADLNTVSEKSAFGYLDWILPIVCDICQTSEEIESIFCFFSMSSKVVLYFYSECTKNYLKASKDKKDYAIICEYLDFVFVNSDANIRKEVGKAMCKLNKQKLAEIDEMINDKHRSQRQLLKNWGEIKETAESTNSFLNDIGNSFRGLFNRNKK